MLDAPGLRGPGQHGQTMPGIWRGYQHELFKALHQRFYGALVLLPLALAVLLCLFLLIVNYFIPTTGTAPQVNGFTDYDLGTGLFAYSADMILNGLANLYTIVVVVGCAQAVANEYRWNTIKMLALRIPSRARLVLAKCLFAATLVGAVAGAFVLGWLLFTFTGKVIYHLPLAINAEDADAIGKSLYYFAIARLQVVILALLALALTFRFRSIIGGIITYIVYSTLDTQLSHLGAAARLVLRQGLAPGDPEWIRPILEALQVINPYLLTSNIDRLAMRAEKLIYAGGDTPVLQPNNLVVLSTPAAWAWFMLALYLVGFALLAVWIFARRDITD